MSLKTLFIITAVVATVFGVLFVFIPATVYSFYDIESIETLTYMGQLFGAALLAIGLIAWKSRNASNSDARKAIIFSLFIADGIGFIVALIGQLNNVVNVLGWGTVAIYLLLSAGFGYFNFSKTKSE